MMWGVEGEETALVALVPEADPVVGAWRERLDASAADGLGAHVTMLYPFADPARLRADHVEQRVQRVAASHAPLRFELAEVCWFGEEVVWLRPDPDAHLHVLGEALQAEFPEHPRYGGTVDHVVQHVTIGAHGDLVEMRRAAEDVGRHLPITCRVDELSLVVRERGTRRWVVAHRFPFGG